MSAKNAQDVGSGRDQAELQKIMLELDNLKKQSERLDRVNKLHARVAGVLSLSGMIEAYSVWLMPFVPHELIGYNNIARNKRHLFCSGHGPQRRHAIHLAEQLIKGHSTGTEVFTENDGHFAYKWIFETADDAGIFLILKRDRQLRTEEIQLVNQSLEILAECLRRGLEYEDLFEKASYDALTGIANRRVFLDRIHPMMDSAKRYGHPLSMISMDLDKFKEINDNLGHQQGDETLKKVANVLKAAVRSTDLLVRMGGDEFIIVLDQTDVASARILAERLCAAVDNLDIWANDTIKLGVSIGLSELKDGEVLEGWLERTDDLLYHAKAEGRSRVSVE